MTSPSPALARSHSRVIILVLGALSTVSPLSIDMYLSAFPQIALDLHTSTARVALSLSSYFVGLAVGQLFYGPLLDRFGRKPPLYFGLALYLLSSLGCLSSQSVEALILFRFIQALGGCAAQVASVAMVRDFFPPEQSAKVFSLLVLILGVSPLLAPTMGGLISVHFGWHGVFIALVAAVALITLATSLYLPEGHKADSTIELRAKPILDNFISVFKQPQFFTYSLVSAFSFAGLLVYVAGSPIIFMEIFQLSPQQYGLVFALLSIGFIGASQINILLLKKFTNAQILQTTLFIQTFISLFFVVGAINGWFGLIPTFCIFLCLLSCLGIINPNGAALALSPFKRNVGSASALLGFLQIGIPAIASSCVGLFEVKSSLPTACVLAGTTLVACAILLMNKGRLQNLAESSDRRLDATSDTSASVSLH